MKILIIEDDIAIAKVIASALQEERMEVDRTIDGAKGLNMALATVYDAVILDLMLPNKNGDEICKQLQIINPNLVIIAVTALNDLNTKIKMFNLGIDDFLTKPFEMPELLARLRAALRKQRIKFDKVLTYNDLVLDLERHEVAHKGNKVILRDKEIKILEYMMRHAEQVLTREMILSYAWGPTVERFTNVVDVHVHSLRNKIDKPYGTKLFRTINNVGYKLSK